MMPSPRDSSNRRVAPAPRWPRRTPYVLVAATITALVIGLAGVGYLLEKRGSHEQAHAATQNVSRLLEQHISAVFDKVDVVLQTVAFHHQDEVARGRLDPAATDAYLIQQNSLLPEVLDLRIVDRDGLIRFGRGVTAEHPVSVSDRAYFIRARDDPAAGLVIDGPLIGRISGQKTLIFARRLNAPDGSFAGVVIGNFLIAYFTKFLSSVELGAQGTAFIRTADLALVHRSPSAPSVTDRHEISKQLRDIEQAGSEADAFTTTTALDGVDRINIYRKLQRYPFYVIVGRAATNAQLGGWRYTTWMICALAALAILVTGLTARSGYRNARRRSADAAKRERLGAELGRHRRELEELVKERTQAVVARERVLNVILNGIPGRVGYWDRDQINRFANPALLAWLGLTEGQIEGQHLRDTLDEPIYELEQPMIEAALRGEAPCFERAYPHPTIAGRFSHAQMHYLPDRSEGAEVAGFFMMAFDIGAIKRAQAQAEAANEAKSAFIANMSHEIRTPLNAIVGLTDLLAGCALDRSQRDFVDKLHLSTQALRALIDDILDFSRIEAGALQLEQAPFSLHAILHTTAAVLSASLRDKPVEALFDVGADLPDALVGDALRLQQILLNLVSNAVKFTQTGEIVVSVRCLAREAERVTLQFSVRDTGIGIPGEQLDAIFGVFTQVDTSVSRQYGGTGLGLAISGQLAQLMGGRITVQTTLGQGSEFGFAVTLGATAQAPAPPRDASLSGLNLLIVDNHPLARSILQQACADFGWRATAVESGVAGLAELRRSAADGGDYDLMLLDWRMPGMDGLEMLRQAYAAPDIGLPLVVLMASTFELGSASAAGDDLYLDGIVAKPIMPASLLEAVRWAYAGHYPPVLPAPQKSDRRLAGLRLLVAEDNELNQYVIELMLTRAGAEVVIAGNGLAAVKRLRAPEARFDAVLMDIQMPVMDGYTATRIIREEIGLVDLPIIAVTAHARVEDREKSRNAGMAGHLAKPIDIDDLIDLLAGRPLAGVPERAPAVVDVEAGLKLFGGDQANYQKLLRKFIATHRGDVAQASRLFSAGDLNGAADCLHGLCGVANMLQAQQLARLSAAAELALRDARGPAPTLQALLDELALAMSALEAFIAQFDAGGGRA